MKHQELQDAKNRSTAGDRDPQLDPVEARIRELGATWPPQSRAEERLRVLLTPDTPGRLNRLCPHPWCHRVMHDVISDILDWDEAHAMYLGAEGATGERYAQRLVAAERMAEIEARWQHLPGGFHGERKRIKLHIRAVADAAPSMSSEELCWLAIAAASAWIPPS